jgi:hypothetical protein
MRKLFLPRRLRYHLPISVQKHFRWVAVGLFTLSLFLGSFTIYNELKISETNLLKNKELLKLKIASKRDSDKLKEYKLIQTELSNRYVLQRTNQQYLFGGFIITLGFSVLLFKLRKNLRK